MSVSASQEVTKGHCPACGPDRLADVVASYSRHESDGAVWSNTDYKTLRCRGCEEVYIQTVYVFSEDIEHVVDPDTGEYVERLNSEIEHWPAPSKRERPDWSNSLIRADGILQSLFDEVYIALDNDLRVLAAMGIRTLFDRASDLLAIDQSKNFSDKLKELVEIGKIGRGEKDILSVLTEAGNAAAHRGWEPEPTQLNTMMSLIEQFLYRTFILDPAAHDLKAKVPPRRKREAV